MKNKNNVSLVSIRTNKEIVAVLQHSHKVKTREFNLWWQKHNDEQTIFYALLVTKSAFKLAVMRNKIKRIIRNALQLSTISGGFSLLVKPTVDFQAVSFCEQLKKIGNNSYKRYVNF